MNESVLYSLILMTILGLVSSAILFLIAKYFYIYEDPKINVVVSLLPSANCGGCGSPGCKAFAEKLVTTEDISRLFCPVGGNESMQKIGIVLGKTIEENAQMVAVMLCQGSCDVRAKSTQYEGPRSCAIESLIYSGETDCQYGCLSEGDCVKVCLFDAMYMDEKTGLPVIFTEKCTGCNVCVTACPRDIIELRPKNKKDLKIYVACLNEDKGGFAKKSCTVACIGCSKCLDVCPKEAITIDKNLAYINAVYCTLCRKCVEVCPTNSIIETNFPPRKKNLTEIEKI